MLPRALDVVFQHMFRLIAGIVAVPVAAGLVGLVMDHSSTVEARIWADHPLYTPAFATDQFATTDSPSDIESGILRELLDTTSFSSKVLAAADPQFTAMNSDQQSAAMANLQKHTTVSVEGTHLFTVSYQTANAEQGRTMVQAIVTAFGSEVQNINSNQIAMTQQALQSQADSAQADMNAAVKQLQSYQAGHPSSASTNDPEYQSLQATAQAKTDRYLSIKSQLDDAQGSQTAVSLQSSFFHVVDQPFVVPFRLDQHSVAFKYAGGALVAILGVEALLVYVIARRDPRIRSVLDVRQAGGFKPLGSAPSLSRQR
jgi:hypothetical protein